MPKSFEVFALEKDLDDLTFPYSGAGLKVFRKIYTTLKIFIIVGIISVGLKVGVGFIPPSLSANLGQALSYVAIAQKILWIAFTVAGLLFVATIILYMIITVLRWRSYERTCFKNDRHAEKFRKKLIKVMKVNEQISRQEDVNSKEESQEDSNGKKGSVSIENKNKLENLKRLRNMEVRINTRQSLDSKAIKRHYTILVDMPDNHEERQGMLSLVEPLGRTANRVDKSELRFGDLLEFEDGSKISYQDAYPVKDKYDRVVKEKNVEKEKYEFSIDLTLFEDRTDEIVSARLQANQWASKQASVLDKLFLTSGSNSRRTRVMIGASTALIEYELSLDTKSISNIETQEKTIDKAFDISGTKISLSGKKLSVSLPLPKDKVLPVDVPSMYRETFGSEI